MCDRTGARYARFVGWIGALALVLGVSAAVIATPAIGWAQSSTRLEINLFRLLFNRTPQAGSQTVNVVLSSPTDTTDAIPIIASDPDGDSLTYRLLEPPVHGIVTIDSTTGKFVYNPDDAFAVTGGTDTIKVVVSDHESGFHLHGLLPSLLLISRHEAVATVTVNLAPVQPLIAENDAYTTDEDVPLDPDAAHGVLANDTDPNPGDSQDLSATVVTGPLHGTLSLDTDGGFQYTPDENYSGSDSFTYLVTHDAQTAQATVSITIYPVADAPTVTVQHATGDEDTAIPLDITVALVDTDGSETLGTITISGVPAGAILNNGTETSPGSWTLTPADLSGLTFTPPVDFFGTLLLTVTATSVDDTSTATSSAQLSVTVTPVPDVPAVIE